MRDKMAAALPSSRLGVVDRFASNPNTTNFLAGKVDPSYAVLLKSLTVMESKPKNTISEIGRKGLNSSHMVARKLDS